MYKTEYANLIRVMCADVIKKIYPKIGLKLIKSSIKDRKSMCGKDRDNFNPETGSGMYKINKTIKDSILI